VYLKKNVDGDETLFNNDELQESKSVILFKLKLYNLKSETRMQWHS
jgi:hypothetical protein